MASRNNFTSRKDFGYIRFYWSQFITKIPTLRSIIILCIIILTTASSFSQVKIRERIQINPRQSGLKTTSSSLDGYLHNIRFEFKVSPADSAFQPGILEFYAPGDSTTVGYYVGDSLVFGVDIMQGQSESVVSSQPDIGTLIVDCVGQGECWITPYFRINTKSPPFMFPYTLSWKVTVDGVEYENWEHPIENINFDYDEGSGTNWFTGIIRGYYFTNMRSLNLYLRNDSDTEPTFSIVKGNKYALFIEGEEITEKVTVAPPFWCPTVDPVTVSIVKGAEYAWLVHGDERLGEYSGLIWQGMPNLQTARDVPDSVDQYCVIRTQTWSFVRYDTAWFLPKDTLLVTFEPSRMTLGDTAIIHMHQRRHGVVLEEECTEAREVGILGDNYYGTLLNENGDTATYFSRVSGQLKFIAAQDMESVPDTVWIRVGLFPPGEACSVKPSAGRDSFIRNQVMTKIDGKWEKKVVVFPFGKYDSRKSGGALVSPGQDNVIPGQIPQIMSSVRTENKLNGGNDFQQKESATAGVRLDFILLGQTKYYQAVKDAKDTKKLNIIETGKDLKENGIKCNFSVSTVITGQRLGVYYEYRDSTGNELDSNRVIRLIGRYWRPDTTYKVRLTANEVNGPRSDTIVIEVKKPDSLGNSQHTAIDVFGREFNFDSLMIYHAGKSGVLPQYLKAMISKESMGCFDPCYRYEPFTDMSELQVKDRTGKYEYEDLTPYRILSSTDKGTPDIPTGHSNKRDASCIPCSNAERISYPGYTNLWDYYWNHRDFHGLNHYTGNNDFENHWENARQKMPEKLFKKDENNLLPNEKRIADDSTDSDFFRWVRYDYNGGMNDKVAQTRISASYGLLQLVYYYTAYNTSREYPIDAQHRPEDINDHSIGFQYGVQHLIGKFNLPSVLNGHFNDSTWQAGLELKYKRAIGKYNGAGDTYANDVISRVSQYLPKP